jgi:hemolysin D
MTQTPQKPKALAATAKGNKSERSFAAGEFIFEEGAVGDFAYVVVSGDVEICRLAQGEYTKLMEVKPGTLFGEMALIDKSERAASARAITDVVVREIDEKALMAYIKGSPDVALNMMYRLANYARASVKELDRSVFSDHHPPSTEENREVLKGASGQIKNLTKRAIKWETDAEHIINEFQSDQVKIQKSNLPPIVQFAFLSILLFFLSTVLWASLSIIDTTISARGRLSTTLPTISVQATDSSVVKAIKVGIGERVKEGDILVVLDETYAESDLSRAQNEANLLSAKVLRLKAELNKEEIGVADKMINSIQREIFLNRRKEYTSKIISFDLDIKSLRQKISMTLRDIGLAKEQLEIQKDLEKVRKSLYDREVGSRLNFLLARNTRLSAQREYSTVQNSISNQRSDLGSVRASMQAFISAWFSGIGVELAQAIKETDANKEELVKLNRRKENVNILAPAAGTIMSMENLFVGAIVKEGGMILTLVPSDVPLIVELDVDPRDIGNLILGAHTSVKLGALPYQKHGEILGEISFISQDTVDKSLDGQPGTYYRARASIGSNELKNLPNNFRLVPGMLLTGDIRAGRRRLITYFIYPVIRTIETSFSEPGR